MGSSRFKLSDIMPNAWFYKLRDMGRGKNQTTSLSRKKKQSSLASTTQLSKPKQPHQCNPRKSYYFTRELAPTDRIYTLPSPAANLKASETNFPEPPRRSSKQRSRRAARTCSPKLVSSSVSSDCSCRNTLESVWTKSGSPPDQYSPSSPSDYSAESEFAEPQIRTDRVLPTKSFDEMVSWSNTCACRLNSNANDIVIDVDQSSLARKDDKLDDYDSFSVLELPPIVAKPEKFNGLLIDAKKKETKPRSRMAWHKVSNVQGSLRVKIVKENASSIKEQKNTAVRRLSVSSPGVKLRTNSPRIASRKIQGHGRKSVSSTTSSSSRRSLLDSFAIVKSSFNPQRDFRESMVEMIVENNIRASKDLEDLLACYLSLNSDEYHDLIIKVFKKIWYDLTDTR